MNINWWIRNIRPNYCISEFKCNLNSSRLSFETCNVFRVIIILYTIDLYVVLIPQNDSKWNKIVSIQTMSNPKILCLPPIANTLRDLYMRFTWVKMQYINAAWQCSLVCTFASCTRQIGFSMIWLVRTMFNQRVPYNIAFHILPWHMKMYASLLGSVLYIKQLKVYKFACSLEYGVCYSIHSVEGSLTTFVFHCLSLQSPRQHTPKH